MQILRNAVAVSLLSAMLAGGMVVAQGPPNKPQRSPGQQGPSRPQNPSRPQGPQGPSRPQGPGSGPGRPQQPPQRPPQTRPPQGPGPRPPQGPPGRPQGPQRPPAPRPPMRPPAHSGWRPPRPPGAGGGYVYHNDWRRGRRMPMDYWGRGVVITDYHRYHLVQPPYGYEWRYIDGNYVLAAVATGLIASILIAATQ